MIVPQLKPLLVFTERLEHISGAAKIASEIKSVVAKAASPSMGQNACEHIITMCNPKGWGDRDVPGMNHKEWLQLLHELSNTADECGQAIFDAL